ncbi:MAG: hypothetical protein QXI52_02620 [Nitrososphaerota archaeon]
MRVRLTLGLVDRPGTLLNVLEQIAIHGGNIISIIHNRDRITAGYVPVSINVEFPSIEQLEKAKIGIESIGVPVMEAETLEKKIETLLLIGSIDIDSTTEAIQMEGGKVVGLSLTGSPSSACLKLIVETPLEKRQRLIKSLETLAESQASLLIREEES